MSTAESTLANMVQSLPDKRGWGMVANEDGSFWLKVGVGGGRMQQVFVKCNGKDLDGNDLVLICSRACEVKKIKGGFLKRNNGDLIGLLAENWTNPHVSYAVQSDEANTNMIYSKACRMLENLSQKELETIVLAAAAQADALEKEKCGEDQE